MAGQSGKATPSEQRRQDAARPSRKALPNFLGREADIARIEGLIDGIQDGGAALVISGEAGIGKTTLLEFAQALAKERGFRRLYMSGAVAEAHLPFAALQQALAPILRKADKLPVPQRAALLAAFGLGGDTTAPDLFLVALATLTLLTESAARNPILLVADDIQWLDQPSYDVLSFISRRLSSDPIFLLMAMRDGTESAPPPATVPRLHLSRLGDAASERLLDAEAPHLPPDLRHQFLEMAAGNPLALIELPRGQQAQEQGDSRWAPLTNRLERAFYSRVASLPTDTRDLLLIIAENDSRFLREALEAGEVLLHKQLQLEVLAPAVSAMLIEITAGEVRFRHPLVRSAVHQAASPLMRHSAHAALARVIADQPDRRIWHRMASAIGPDETLASDLDDAATRARQRGAIAIAIDALENAARFSGTPEARAVRLLRAAELAAELVQPQTVERLLRGADLDQAQPRVRALIAWIREMSQPLMVSDLSRISVLLNHAAAARADGASDLALDLLWRAAQRCWWSNAGTAVRATVFAAACGLGLEEADARLIAIPAYVGPLEHGGDVYRKLRTYPVTHATDALTIRTLGLTANTIGAFDIGVTWLTESSLALREQGRLSDLARVLFSRAYAEMETGDWMGAMKSAEEAAQFSEESNQPIWIAAAAIVQAKLAGMRGNFDVAETHATRAERLALSPRSSFLLALLQNARGIAAIGAGRPAEAFEHLRRLCAPEDPAANTSLKFFSLADYVEAAIACGQEADAAALIEDVERQTASKPVPWVHTMLCYGKALLASPTGAENFFQSGLNATAHDWPFLRARLLLAYGEWLRRQRRIAEARVPLRTARDVFDALGASPWSERARQELRASGEASRPRTELVLDALTPQELHIAELAADGLSNKEIGARLYLSHRTVGYHLHRIFPKLGITARGGLRTALDRATQGSTQPPRPSAQSKKKRPATPAH